MAFAEAEHTTGFARYARVDRADGSYREMLVDAATLNALQANTPLPEGATILMESYYRPGEIGSIFAKRFEGGRWLYGSFRSGEPLPTFSPMPQCAGCHRAAGASEETFTLRMLERFAQTGALQQTHCNRAGRAPCEASIYSGQ
ncbi:hypothetical protein [Chelativorans alearense]|uniref:hypothetical protein n=1 Tax=Chelativorans alearense TaxID=2681495 RepID=UPI00196A13D9|nr:hypothetical protein [Chelativorans alearense]